MAKGVEDTAYYRWTRFVALNEVGGDPARFGLPPADFHAALADRQDAAPGRDDRTVHPRHQAVRGRPGPAGGAGRDPGRVGRGGGPLVGSGRRRRTARSATCSGRRWSGPGRSSGERLYAYLDKACREARTRTSWDDPDAAFEAAMHAVADGRAGAGPAARRRGRVRRPDHPAGLVERADRDAGAADHAGRAGHLPGQRAVGPLAGRPGQPAAGRLRAAATGCWPGWTRAGGRPGTTRTARPSCSSCPGRCGCGGTGRACSPAYAPLAATGPAADHVVAFDRGGRGDGRHPAAGPAGARRRLAGHHASRCPAPTCSPGASYRGETRLADLLADYPVALLAP